ncbi:protein jag [Olsenella uli]|uniref:Jag family protein n=1 Tax=Olsenella uli TaxID=133926 RepID=UPI00056D4074|nr:R3H domain-containing nucleic acid-binding protein [Olsenella uli]
MEDERDLSPKQMEGTLSTPEPRVDGELESLRLRYEAGESLSDEEVDRIADIAVTYVKSLLSYFGETQVAIDEYDGDEGELILDVSGGNLAVLIGRHGRTLEALQMIVSSFMSNKLHFRYPVSIDIEGYKSRRKEKVKSLARSAANRAIRQQGQVVLAPMNAYERRLVHLTLLENEEVSTHSEGEDPDRRVIITFVR